MELLEKSDKFQLDPYYSYTGTPYPIGLDPVSSIHKTKN